uniref:Uncharacterized protein n=1 Tax=Anguilla anguilla TaxID=7936 RepID=A0A0E9V093_ANGAN
MDSLACEGTQRKQLYITLCVSGAKP